MSGLSNINDEYIAIFRYKTHGHRFELLCRRQEVSKFLTEDNRLHLSVIDDDAVLAKFLQKPTIYFNAKKKEIATQSSLQEAFGAKSTVREIILQILSRGDIVETQKDRDASKHGAEAIREEVLRLLPFMLLNPFSGVNPEPFEVKDAVTAVISKWKPSTCGVPLLSEAGYVASQIAHKMDCVRVVKKIVLTYNKSTATKQQVSAWHDFLISHAPVVTALDSFTVPAGPGSASNGADEVASAAEAKRRKKQEEADKKKAKAAANRKRKPKSVQFNFDGPAAKREEEGAKENEEEGDDVEKANDTAVDDVQEEGEKDHEEEDEKEEEEVEEESASVAPPADNTKPVFHVKEILLVDALLLVNTRSVITRKQPASAATSAAATAEGEEKAHADIAAADFARAVNIKDDPQWKRICESFAISIEEVSISDDERRQFSDAIFDPPMPSLNAQLKEEDGEQHETAVGDKYHHTPDLPADVAAAKAAKQREMYEKRPDSLEAIVLNRQIGEPEVIMKGNNHKKGGGGKQHRDDDGADFSDEEDGGKKGGRRKGGKSSSTLSAAAELEQEYLRKTHKELQELCKKKGMSTGGKKEDLVDRIVAYELNK